MRHTGDIKSLWFLGAIALLRTIVFCFFSWWMIGLTPLIILLVLITIAIKHNHVHFPVFYSRQANLLFGLGLNLLTGNTISGIKIIHLLNHHLHVDGNEDWGNTQRYEDLSAWKSFNAYMLTTPFSFRKNLKEWLNEHEDSPLVSTFRWENGILLFIYALLAFLNLPAAFFSIFLPNFLSQFFLVAFNYLQHHGCEPTSLYNQSRNITGKMFNYFAFNVGYHTAHHFYPSLHWSELRSAFEQLNSHIDPRNNHDSFFTAMRAVLTHPSPFPKS